MLCEDILLLILTNVDDPKTLHSLNLTNKFFNNICQNQDSFWNEKYVKLTDQHQLLTTSNKLVKYEILFKANILTNRIITSCEKRKERCRINPYTEAELIMKFKNFTQLPFHIIGNLEFYVDTYFSITNHIDEIEITRKTLISYLTILHAFKSGGLILIYRGLSRKLRCRYNCDGEIIDSAVLH
jgi:hypothetical protein